MQIKLPHDWQWRLWGYGGLLSFLYSGNILETSCFDHRTQDQYATVFFSSPLQLYQYVRYAQHLLVDRLILARSITLKSSRVRQSSQPFPAKRRGNSTGTNSFRRFLAGSSSNSDELGCDRTGQFWYLTSVHHRASFRTT